MALFCIKAILLHTISCACLICLYALCFALPNMGCISFIITLIEGFMKAPCASLHIITGATQHEDAGRNPDNPLYKKQRHVWTSEAHHEFSIVVKALGDSK